MRVNGMSSSNINCSQQGPPVQLTRITPGRDSALLHCQSRSVHKSNTSMHWVVYNMRRDSLGLHAPCGGLIGPA
jgi:hypothetical protein